MILIKTYSYPFKWLQWISFLCCRCCTTP